MGETARNEAVKHNHLATAEMGNEENYNQIDGVINNTKPSILEYLRSYEPPPPGERGGVPEKTAAREF